MDSQTIFVRTIKGQSEAQSSTTQLPEGLRRALMMVDGIASLDAISKRAAPSLRSNLLELIKELVKEGYIEDKIKAAFGIVIPQRMATPIKKQSAETNGELDFTSAFRVPTPEMLAAEAEAERKKVAIVTRALVEAEAKARAFVQLKATQEAARLKLESDAIALVAKLEIEAVRYKAQQDAERRKEEREASRVREATERNARENAEAARDKAEREIVGVRAELEATKEKAEVESKARVELLRRAREASESVKLKSQQEAVAALHNAKQDAINARVEVEAARQYAAMQAQEHESIERHYQEQAEVARARAEQEIVGVRAELEAAKVAAEMKARAEVALVLEVEANKLKAQQRVDAEHKADTEQLRAEQDAARSLAENELALVRARVEAEHQAREQAESARVQAEQVAAHIRAELEAAKKVAKVEYARRMEADEARLKAQVEADQSKVEHQAAEQRARAEAESARLQAEQEAKQVRAELEAAKAAAKIQDAKHVADEKIRLMAQVEADKSKAEHQAAEHRARADAESARLQAEQEALHLQAEIESAQVALKAEDARRIETEAARLKAQSETAIFEVAYEPNSATEVETLEAVQEVVQLNIAGEVLKAKSPGVADLRSKPATVLFFDVVGYTKQFVQVQQKIKDQFNELVTECLNARNQSEFIILDTGDGAAIGFLEHPEDALEVAMKFRKLVMLKRQGDFPHKNSPALNVRIGIHLGPINVVKDMNGQSNMVGDGINDAQRVMSFAGADQVYVSGYYYDFVSRLSDEYKALFQYRGMQKDKHNREHQLYELVEVADTESIAQQERDRPAALKLEPFSLTMPEPTVSSAPVPESQPWLDDAVVEENIDLYKLSLCQDATEQPLLATAPSDVAIQGFKVTVDASVVARDEIQETVLAGTQAVEMVAVKPLMPTAEEIKGLAEQQVRLWAEAERRSTEATVSQQISTQPPQTVKKVLPRARLKPVHWGKIAAGLLVALPFVLIFGPSLVPTQGYATRLEQRLGLSLQQPVHIGRLKGRLLPSPSLEINDLVMGEVRPFQVQQLRINFAWSALFAAHKQIEGIEMDGVKANEAAFPKVFEWIKKINSDTQYSVAHIGLDHAKLEAEGVQLSGIAGELNFNPSGKFTRAKLHSEGNKLALEIIAAPENKLRWAVALHNSPLPFLADWVFDELDAKGELAGNNLAITDLDGRIFGGILRANAQMNWDSGWRAQGELTVKNITLQNIHKSLEGDMEGTAKFQMQAERLSGLRESAAMDGNFAIYKGLIHGIDMVGTARLRSKEMSQGGRTHFDALSGELTYAKGEYHARKIKMNAGVLNANATLDIAGQQLSGRVAADLGKLAGIGTVILQIGGTTDKPSLRTTR